MTTLRRPLLLVLVAMASAGGFAACGEQTRNGNPEVQEDRLDQRREPADATDDPQAPTTPGTSTSGGTTSTDDSSGGSGGDSSTSTTENDTNATP